MTTKPKWIWEDNWEGKISCSVLHKDGTTTEYQQSRCLAIPGCEIKVYELYRFGKFAIKMRFLNTFWMNEKIFDINLPISTKTLMGAKRKASDIVRREVGRIHREQIDKYQRILDQL